MILVMDHFCPAKDIAAATNAKIMPGVRPGPGNQATSTRAGPSASSTPFCRSRGWWRLAKWCSAPTPTPAPTGLSAASPAGVGHTDLGVAWGTGEMWMKVPEEPARSSSTVGQREMGIGQGRDPSHHRPDRRGGRQLHVHGVQRRRRRSPDHGGSLHHRQHGRRVPRARRRSSPSTSRTREFVTGRVKRPYTVYEPDPGARYDGDDGDRPEQPWSRRWRRPSSLPMPRRCARSPALAIDQAVHRRLHQRLALGPQDRRESPEGEDRCIRTSAAS